MGSWLNKLWFRKTMKYYVAIKKESSKLVVTSRGGRGVQYKGRGMGGTNYWA